MFRAIHLYFAFERFRAWSRRKRVSFHERLSFRSFLRVNVFRTSCQIPIVVLNVGEGGGGVAPTLLTRRRFARACRGVTTILPSSPFPNNHLTLITPRITCVIKKSAACCIQNWQRDKISNMRPAGRPHLTPPTGPRFCAVFLASITSIFWRFWLFAA